MDREGLRLGRSDGCCCCPLFLPTLFYDTLFCLPICLFFLTPFRPRPPLGRPLLIALLLAASLALSGCGFFSSDDKPLPGVYESGTFRIQTTSGEVIDVGEAGGRLEMTLMKDGQVRGQLYVPADDPIRSRPRQVLISFGGTYERDGEYVRFDFGGALSRDYFDTGTPLGAVPWSFYENDGILRADADRYVIFLGRKGPPGGGERTTASRSETDCQRSSKSNVPV